jgi:hypothetical protein
MSLMNWFRKKAAALSISLTNVEKEFINQKNNGLTNTIDSVTSVHKGTVADDLIRGEMTQEVKNLRWRTYKIMQETKKWAIEKDKNTGELNADRKNIYNVDYQKGILKMVRVDNDDSHPTEMVVSNEGFKRGILETDAEGVENYHKLSYTEKPIRFEYEFMPKYEFTDFVTKLVVRNIQGDEKLLEFYVSKYPDPNNFTTNIFLKDINKLMGNPTLKMDILEFKEIGFLSDKTIGVDDFLIFTFKNEGFYKIIEFDGNYILKFKATVITNGENILEKFKEEELEKKYDNNEVRNNTI